MKVSVVIAVYNTAKYLEQCLKSIFNQTMSSDELEIVIVNDGSTDNSMDVIRKITAERSNVIIIDKKVNESTFWGRVDGMLAASGDYVGFIDSDDWIEPNMFETMYLKGTSANVDIVECGTIYENADGTSRPIDIRVEKNMPASQMIKEYSQHAIQVALYIRLFSKNVIERFRSEIYPYFEARHEEYVGARTEDDLLFPLLFSRADRMLYIEESFCHHRLEVKNSSMYVQRNDMKKLVDSYLFRVKAGFVNMDFSVQDKEVFSYIAHKQIDIIFATLGKMIETQYYSKDEAARLIYNSINCFRNRVKLLPPKDMLRFWHLRIKALYCYGFRWINFYNDETK